MLDPRDHERLVIGLALRHGADRETVRDSEQYSAGMLALVEACRRFDPARRVQPSTYLWRCVDGKIRIALHRRRAGEPCCLHPLPDGLEAPGFDDEACGPCTALLAFLDRRSRRLVEAVVIEGRTVAEAAARYGEEREQARQLVQAGLDRLRVLAGAPKRVKRNYRKRRARATA